MKKTAFNILAALFSEALRQVIGSRFSDEGLSASWGSVEQKPLGRAILESLKELRVQDWEFNGILNSLDGLVKSAYL